MTILCARNRQTTSIRLLVSSAGTISIIIMRLIVFATTVIVVGIFADWTSLSLTSPRIRSINVASTSRNLYPTSWTMIRSMIVSRDHILISTPPISMASEAKTETKFKDRYLRICLKAMAHAHSWAHTPRISQVIEVTISMSSPLISILVDISHSGANQPTLMNTSRRRHLRTIILTSLINSEASQIGLAGLPMKTSSAILTLNTSQKKWKMLKNWKTTLTFHANMVII